MTIYSNVRMVNTVCGICNASCGMQLHFMHNELLGVKGNKEHPVSRGYLCPKDCLDPVTGFPADREIRVRISKA